MKNFLTPEIMICIFLQYIILFEKPENKTGGQNIMRQFLLLSIIILIIPSVLISAPIPLDNTLTDKPIGSYVSYIEDPDAVFTITAILVVPLLLDQLTSLFNNIIAFTQDMSTKFNVNASSFQETLLALL